jgi:hypothetical protein
MYIPTNKSIFFSRATAYYKKEDDNEYETVCCFLQNVCYPFKTLLIERAVKLQIKMKRLKLFYKVCIQGIDHSFFLSFQVGLL